MPSHSYEGNLNIQRNIYKGIVATSIKYTMKDIENLLILVPSRVCQLLRMNRKNLQLFEKSAHVHKHQKNSDRQVTIAIELSMEQCEVKPQIGSLVCKEFSHTSY